MWQSSDNRRQRSADGVGEKNGSKADALGEQSADQRAEGKTKIIDAVKAAEHAAALIGAHQVDAGDLTGDYPDTVGDADEKYRN